MSKTIAFVSAFVSAVSFAIIFKLCLIYTCESLIYANALLSTTFTILVCLKTFEMRNKLDEYERCVKHVKNDEQPRNIKNTLTLIDKLSIIKDIQLSFVIPCIVSVIDEMYETFGWCLNPVFVLIEKYLQIFQVDEQQPDADEAQLKYVEVVQMFYQKINAQLDNNTNIRVALANVLQEIIDEIEPVEHVDFVVEEQPVEQPVEEPVEEPVEQPVDQPVEQPVEEPVINLVEEQPIEQPIIEEPIIQKTIIETNSDDSIDYSTVRTNNA